MHPPLPSNGFSEKIIGMLESLLLNEGAIGRDKAELLGCALIDEFIMIVGLRGFFTGPTTLRAHFFLFARHWARARDRCGMNLKAKGTLVGYHTPRGIALYQNTHTKHPKLRLTNKHVVGTKWDGELDAQ